MVARTDGRGLAWSVATWGTAVCAALVMSGSIAPWAVNGQVVLSGLAGDGRITLLFGLLALLGALLAACRLVGFRDMGWPVLCCLGFAGLVIGFQWTAPGWFGSRPSSGFLLCPGTGAIVVLIAALVGRRS